MMPKFEYILCCSLLYTYYVLHQPPPTERNKPEREIQTNRKNTRKDNFEKKRRRYRPRKKREEEIQSNCLIWCFLFGLFVVCFSNFKHTLNKKQLCIRIPRSVLLGISLYYTFIVHGKELLIERFIGRQQLHH
jgi:hypothetical protein